MDVQPKKPNIFAQYKGRHIVLAVALVLLGIYFIVRSIPAAASFAYDTISQTWHKLAGSIFGLLPFSVAEWLVVLAVGAVLVYCAFSVYWVIKSPFKLQRVYGSLIALLASVATVYMLMCWLWSIGFYGTTFNEECGIEAEVVSTQELKEVALYFAYAANEAREEVNEDEDGVYVCNEQEIFDASRSLYTHLPQEFAFLEGQKIRPKALVFSELQSQMGFTGFFFPYTGESNINVLNSDCFIPATVAHELAHQSGVNPEQDANFVAVLVCMESNNPDFTYSGALMAYNHLSNALYRASHDDWAEVSQVLSSSVRQDLVANSAYWNQYKGPVSEASEAVYEEFLHSQGQEMGMQSYGACVDMLVAYYKNK